MVLTIGRLPLSHLGLLPARDPPAVAFQPYSEREAAAILLRELGSKADMGPSTLDLGTLVSAGLMKFAAPFVGRNLHSLLSIGEELLRSPPPEGERSGSAVSSMAVLQQRIERSGSAVSSMAVL